MQSGILFGYVGQVEGIVKRMKWHKTRTESHCDRRACVINRKRIRLY